VVSLNRWLDAESKEFIKKYTSRGIPEELALRTYSSRLLGRDPELVIHGGGNTSFKGNLKTITGNIEKVMYVKGSGWDLATIEPEGHPAVKLNPLIQLKELNELSDENMVTAQRQNLIDPNSPNPSVEALLHAFIPEKFIDHTHSIAVLALANQPNPEVLCRQIFGEELAIVPYVMPGFDLSIAASKAYFMSKEIADKKQITLKGMILINHGVFSFGNSAKESYDRMIEIVERSNKYLKRKVKLDLNNKIKFPLDKGFLLTRLRGILHRESIIQKCNNRWIFDIRLNKNVEEFLNHKNLNKLVNLGVATPDHVIRTKAEPLLLKSVCNLLKKEDFETWLEESESLLKKYISRYIDYFNTQNKRVGENKQSLDPMPRVLLIPGLGLIGIGANKKSAKIASDIALVWIETVLSAESIGNFKPLGKQDIFDMEYWSLEQAKLGKKCLPPLSGQIVIITGAGGVIGKQIAKDFVEKGCEIICIDINEDNAKKTSEICGPNAKYYGCDITSDLDLNKIFEKVLFDFGGLDILIANAGGAWEGSISEMDIDLMGKSMNLNFFGHFYSSQQALKIFKDQDYRNANNQYLGGQILFNISKQALNPGKNFGSYGIPKAALLALMRQIALEEGCHKIRSNGVNADRIRSGLLNPKLITERAASRGITEKEYMSGNLLNEEVLAKDVSQAFISLSLMEKTTGTILTVDGGNVSAMVR
tara:strand:+ start:2834 stop:4951 length:2118 start_codon:yes stop_codon:yes gene_type:complete